MKKFLFLFLLFHITTAWSQKKVVVRGVIVDNSYDEYSADLFLDSSFYETFFSSFERELEKKLGPVEVIYSGGKKVSYFDVRRGYSWDDAMQAYGDYYRSWIDAKKENYDYLVDVRSSITHDFKGPSKRVLITSRVILKQRKGRAVLKKSGKVKLNIPPPIFDSNHLLIDHVDIMQAFPIQPEEMRTAFTRSVALAFAADRRETINAAGRKKTDKYDSFLNNAITYRLLLRNNFATVKTKVMGINFSKRKSIPFVRLPDNQAGFLRVQENLL